MIWKRYFSLAMTASLILGSWKGYVALFEKNAAEPRQIFSCPVSSLPLSDQMALEQGLPIHNQRQLEQVMEDYLS